MAQLVPGRLGNDVLMLIPGCGCFLCACARDGSISGNSVFKVKGPLGLSVAQEDRKRES